MTIDEYRKLVKDTGHASINYLDVDRRTVIKEKVVYGLQLILDMGKCDISKFKRKHIKSYFTQLCQLIGMEAHAQYFWDDFRVPIEQRQTDARTKGTTAIQFILTSNITIHTLDLLQVAFIDIFSCKDFEPKLAEEFTVRFFGAKEHKSTIVERGI